MSNKRAKRSKATKRIQVIFTQEQYEILQKLKGEMGASDSEVVRNIVLSWLVDNSFITTTIKSKYKGGEK